MRSINPSRLTVRTARVHKHPASQAHSTRAIDAGNPAGCTDGQGALLKIDQRGLPRPNREDTGACDMGAYERQGD